jgi:SAM-dependent methyltransferase
MTTSLPSDFDPLAHFQQLYQQDADPWKVRQRWYEQRKRDILLASLPRQRYRSAFEPACGNGELTAALAHRAERLLASDLSAEAVVLTRRRMLREAPSDAARVTIRQQHMPQDWPADAAFDLIVISEMAYYLDEQALLRLRQCCVDGLAEGGTLVMCHWRRPFDDRRLNTDSVHTVFDATPGLHRLLRHSEDDFLLDVWSGSADSVAQQEGLA